VLVAHACNPSYSGGRDQEDHGSKPAWANSSLDPILKKPFTKIGLVEWVKVKALSLQAPVLQTKQNKKTMKSSCKTETRPKISRKGCGWPVVVVHTYNPSYLGGRDWEDHGHG
jgi:hypothetical protein